MVLALQLSGGLILFFALLQATVGLAGQVQSTLRARRMDERKLEAFKVQTDMLMKHAVADRERSELTWGGKRKFRLAQRRIENALGDVCSFYLEPHDGGRLPPFLPGQFLTFELNVPNQPSPVVRCYSLSDSPMARDHYRVTIKKLGPPPKNPDAPPGLSSNYFHQSLKEGDVVDVMAPNGGFHLDVHSDRPVVLIGGGVGLTPVVSMLKWLAENNSHRETWFFYGVRNSKELALRDEIKEAVDANSHFHSVFVFSQPTEECIAEKAFDAEGFLSVDVMKRYLSSNNYEFYICGPPPMMESITAQLLEWGVPEEDINFEAFGPATVKKVAKAEGHEPAAAGEGINVQFARSGKTIVWTEAAGTLLELGEANGLRLNAGCRAGNCGTCATAVKSGKVSYLSKPASKPAQGTALLCIACPDGEVELDA
jgi:hypothetical protein